MRSYSTPVEEKPLAETVALTPVAEAKPSARGLASLTTALGFGAVTAAAACCVLPLALASLGVGASLAGSFAALAAVRTPLLVIAAFVLTGAWVVWWRARGAACAPGEACAAPVRSRGPLILLIISTVLVGLAGVFPMLEPTLMKWVS